MDKSLNRYRSIAMIGAGILLWLIALWEIYNHTYVYPNWTLTKAEVLSLEPYIRERGILRPDKDRYRYTITYSDDNHTYVSKDDDSGTPRFYEGATIEIIFDPEAPFDFRRSDESNVAPISIIFGSFSIFVGLKFLRGKRLRPAKTAQAPLSYRLLKKFEEWKKKMRGLS